MASGRFPSGWSRRKRLTVVIGALCLIAPLALLDPTDRLSDRGTALVVMAIGLVGIASGAVRSWAIASYGHHRRWISLSVYRAAWILIGVGILLLGASGLR